LYRDVTLFATLDPVWPNRSLLGSAKQVQKDGSKIFR
jgi:hypothetical protein